MKTIEKCTLVYDDSCPLCKGYTSAFIASGMLDTEGRIAYQHLNATEYANIDMHRAKNEIALIDKSTLEVRYGIDSLIHVVASSIPWLKCILNSRPVHLLLKQLYSFISYNRKMIVPLCSDKGICTPDFKKSYRVLYLSLCIAFGSLFAIHGVQQAQSLALALPPHLLHVVYTSFICTMLAAQAFASSQMSQEARWNIVGTSATVILLLAASLYCVLPLINALSGSSTTVVTTLQILILIMVSQEYQRRMRLLHARKMQAVLWFLFLSAGLYLHLSFSCLPTF